MSLPHSVSLVLVFPVKIFPMSASWADILLVLRQNLSEGTCKVWLEPLAGELVRTCPDSSSGAKKGTRRTGSRKKTAAGSPSALWSLTLTAPNSFVAGRVRELLRQPILEAAFQVLGEPVSLEIQAKSSTEPSLPDPLTPEKLAMTLPTAPAVLATATQLTLPMQRTGSGPVLFSGSEWRYSFDDFVVGPCNQLAHAAASHMLQSSMPVDILFLCSDSGLGKTHLTQAVGSAVCRETGRQARVDYLTAEEFTSRFVQASKFGTMDDFKEHFRHLDMLLLEDVHFLRGKDKTQEELLATIKALHAHGGRVVLTSSFAPRDLAGVDSQLVSRFCSGFVASIDRPCKDTRLHILMDKARRHSVILPENVADLLADRITSDVRLLQSCLHNLALKAQLMGTPVTEDMALDVIRSVARQNVSLSLESLVDMICRSFNLSPQQLSSRSRRQELVMARNTAFYLLRRHTSLTLAEIGQQFNRRHSTVIKGITAFEQEISRKSPLGRQLAHTVSLIEKQAARD